MDPLNIYTFSSDLLYFQPFLRKLRFDRCNMLSEIELKGVFGFEAFRDASNHHCQTSLCIRHYSPQIHNSVLRFLLAAYPLVYGCIESGNPWRYSLSLAQPYYPCFRRPLQYTPSFGRSVPKRNLGSRQLGGRGSGWE